jgi:hypothetical protein
VEENRDIQYPVRYPSRSLLLRASIPHQPLNINIAPCHWQASQEVCRAADQIDSEPIFCWDVVVCLLLSTGSLLSTTNVTTKIIPRFVGDSATRPIEWHYLALPFREERSHRSPSALAVLVLFGAIIPDVSSSAAI